MFTVDIVEMAALGVRRPWLRSFVRRAVGRIRDETALGIPPDGEVAIVSVGRARMSRLNFRHRGKPRATDVLSFPQEPPGSVGRRPRGPRAAATHLGDVVICPDVARENARSAGRPYRTEVGVLALHGLLHLLGYDHETDEGEMHALERKLRSSLALGDLGDEDLL